MIKLDDIDVSAVSIRSTAFPDANDLRVWHRLSAREQAALLLRDLREGLDGPAAKRQDKRDIVAAALSRYAAAV